jgi:alginate O-acetyltransferase complex protein AlgI
LLFNSITFFVFLPVVFILYWFVFNRSLRWQNLLLLGASYFFYGWWSYKFLGLLVISTLLDYFYGFGVAAESSRKSKFFLWLTVFNSLGILAIFKYYDFFAKEFADGVSQLGFHIEPYLLNLALPIGISFYTFHGMSYVFDIFRKKQKPIKSLVDYAVFVSFFPLLVAGPIERANHLLPQIRIPRSFNYQQSVEGCRLILWGFFKKVVIADSIASMVNPTFEAYASLDSLSLIIASLGFTFQIYCDFSGYSDIAIGVSKLLGFELLSNFRFPYFSINIPDFWKRWHMSLTNWFRDYLYIPIGGSRYGMLRTVINTFIVFLVSGFWHGANWNFILWGLIHALLFIPTIFFKKKSDNEKLNLNNQVNFRMFSRMLLTFILINFTWIFFRMTNLSDALLFIKYMFSNEVSSSINFSKDGVILIGFILLLLVIDWKSRFNERIIWVPSNKLLRRVSYSLLCFAIFVYYFQSSSEAFIYFQF